MGPIEQEAAKGHKLFAIGSDTYAEVSKFKGIVYVGIRRWFQADDENWYRTKNGLTIPFTDFDKLFKDTKALKAFVSDEVNKINVEG